MSRALHRIGASIVGAIVALVALGATYNQFSPGGALSGTWNSQSVALDSGAFITGVLPSSNGGTANTFFSVSGPATSTKTYTFPNASTTVLTTNAAVTLAQGGTGLTSAADDTTLVSSGSAWAAAAIPNCGDSTHALAYSTSGNAFSCQTVTGSGGVSQTVSTTTLTLTGCTASPTVTFSYVLTGSTVTLMPQAASGACTSNSTSFGVAAGGLPASIRPTRTVTFTNVSSTDNGSASSVGCAAFNADGSLTFSRTISAGVCSSPDWTASGVKAIFNGYQTSFSYPLN